VSRSVGNVDVDGSDLWVLWCRQRWSFVWLLQWLLVITMMIFNRSDNVNVKWCVHYWLVGLLDFCFATVTLAEKRVTSIGVYFLVGLSRFLANNGNRTLASQDWKDWCDAWFHNSTSFTVIPASHDTTFALACDCHYTHRASFLVYLRF